jgi:biopolymer transport protein ExbB/TolQ
MLKPRRARSVGTNMYKALVVTALGLFLAAHVVVAFLTV